jgi:hypothetical protein
MKLTGSALRAWLFLAAAALRCGPLLGQGGRASITGIVTDASGAVVPGASVTATSAGTGQISTAVTTDIGSYVIPLLPVGRYDVTVKKEGFRTETRTGVTITADQAATLNFTLTVGSVAEEVKVAANAEMINVATAALGQVIEKKSIVELPLNGRNPASLVLLSAGMIDVLRTGAGALQSFTTYPTETGASANGGRQGSTYYVLDGANNMDNYHLLAAPFPNPDATQEFRVVTNNFDAQYGFAPGAVVSIVTTSGTNTWHGNAFEFLRNERLNARDFFARTKDRLKRNQFGASVGGPIRRDRLFIFGNYQGTTERLQRVGGTAFVPTDNMMRGDFSGLLRLPRPVQLVDPATRQPYANNLIPASRFNPASVKITESLPRGAEPDGFIRLPGQNNVRDYHEFTVKADFYRSSKHQINGRTYLTDFSQPPQAGGGNLLLSDRSWGARYQNHSVNHLWTITPRVLNNLVGAYSRLNSISESGLRDKNGERICYSKLIKVADYPGTPCSIESLSVANGFGFGQNYNAIRRWTAAVTDSVTYNKDEHLIVAGVDVLRQYWDLGTDWLALPIIGFDGTATNHGISDFLLGRVFSYLQGGGEFQRIRATQSAFYVQDQIRLRPNFTVNLGLRWEPYFPPVPESGRIGAFRPGQKSRRYPDAPAGLVFPGDPGINASAMPRGLDYFNPRLGIAWQPRALPHTSVRAAFGIFTAPIDYSSWNHTADFAPFSPTFQFNRSQVGDIDFSDPWASYAPTGRRSPFPPFPTPNEAPASNTPITRPLFFQAGYSGDFRLARNLSWNLSIERQMGSNWLLRAAYVASETYHLQTPIERNPGIFAAGGQRTYYPEFDSVLENVSWSTSSYQSAQFTAEKRFANGLQFQSNYTLSKTLDSSSMGTLAFRGSVPNPFDLRFNRGLSDLHHPHVLIHSWIYEMPGLKSLHPLFRNIAGSWQLSGIWRFQSGRPFSVSGGFGNNASLAQIFGDRADIVPGQPLNVAQGSRGDWLSQYFNINAFRRNAPGTFGTSARNLMSGPGTNAADLGIAKNWYYHEHYRLQFRWEMFNAFNRPHFNLPVSNPQSTAFGRILGTANIPARVMQAGAKLYW